MSQTSLQGQLTRASLLTTLVVLVLCAGALLAYELMSYRSLWIADLRTQADLIAHSTVAALEFNDPKAAQENLSLLKLQPRVRSAAIYGKSGMAFATYPLHNADVPPSLRNPYAAESARFEGSTLTVLHPIERDGERLGTVELEAQHDVWSRLVPYLAILAVVTAAGLGTAAIVFARLLRKVTRPLRQMSDVAHDVMAQRNWTLRAPQTEYRDMAVLVNAFNGMLSEVQSRTGELEVEMTERVRAEEELRAADRRKDEFLATLAHELRNPLAPMTTSLALMKSPTLAQEVRDKAIAILERQLKHMVRLIDDLLDVSRVTTGKISLHAEPLELVSLLNAAAEAAQADAERSGIGLSVHLPDDPLFVIGDPVRLAQVFSNLLNNACRYTRHGGHIDVSAEVSNDSVAVHVDDTGIGIDPAMQARIFDLFEQGDKTLERGNAGLGIGLTLARQLVKLHGGELSVHSEGAGRGSRFTVRLPLAPARSMAGDFKPPPAALAPSASAAVSDARVLIADDNVDFATSLAQFLRAHGFRVQVVHDGEAAVQAALEAPPELALLDIGMPKLNGYDVARRLRAHPATQAIKLVAITGWGQSADKAVAEQAGFDKHLVKPVEPDALLRVMTSLKGDGTHAALQR